MLLNNKLLTYTTDFSQNQTTPSSEENSNNGSKVKNKLEEMLNINVNENTSTMINDIVESFESSLINKENPLSGIMDVSQKISEKYTDSINNGDIELDKIINSIMNKIPGMNNIVSDLVKNQSKPQQNTDTNFSDLAFKAFASKSSGKNKPSDDVKVMDNTFSTADIELGEVENPNNLNLNIGNIFKIS